MNMQDRAGMQEALKEARKAFAEGEVPVGAALYHGDTLLWADHSLKDCTLYVTLEPCPMCSGALLMSRLGRCVFGAADPESGCCGSIYDLPADPLLHGHTVWEQSDAGEECKELLNRFFSERRPEGGNE